jgi:glutathionylspermidine amidase/synthetase
MTTQANNQPEKFGTVLGMAPGNVPVFSSDYRSADESEFPDRRSYRSFVDGVYMGQKWQCVEFARRWLYLTYGYVFADVSMAYDIFRLSSVKKVADEAELPLFAFRNGSKRRPEAGCMLIWDDGGIFSTTGHVAIVTEVTETGVRVAEQNLLHHKWPDGRSFSREIAASVSADGEYRLECTFGDAIVLGWVLQTDDSRHAEVFTETEPRTSPGMTTQISSLRATITATATSVGPGKEKTFS